MSDQEAARQELAARLQAVYRAAGAPALRDLERLLLSRGEVASASTLSRMFRGTTTQRWPTLKAVLDALGAAPAEQEEVRRCWEGTLRHYPAEHTAEAEPTTLRELPSTELTAASSPADGEECETCGAWVVNWERHLAWHWTIQQQLADKPSRDGTVSSIGRRRRKWGRS